MKKWLGWLLLGSLSLWAEQVEVVADRFSADETKLRSEFVGNVKVTKGKDVLVANQVVITFDEKRQPLKYVATGNAEATVTLKDKTYFVKGQKLTYEPSTLRYTVEKDAFLHEKETDKKVYGDVITVNQTQGTYEVDGKASKPVKFIFQVEEKKQTQKEETK